MDDTGYRRTPIVDIRHRTGNGSGSGDTAEQWSYDIGRTLCDQFRIGIVTVAYHTIGYGGGQAVIR